MDIREYRRCYYRANKHKWEKDKDKRRKYSWSYYRKNLKRLREKGREYITLYREKYPVQTAQSSERSRRKRGERNRAYIETHKAKLGCFMCGERDPIVLDLHHRNPKQKRFTISHWLWRASIKMLDAEFKKCDVICANDHRRIHNRGKRGRQAKV